MQWENGRAYHSIYRTKLCFWQADYGKFPFITSKYKTVLPLLVERFTYEKYDCRVIKPGSERINITYFHLRTSC